MSQLTLRASLRKYYKDEFLIEQLEMSRTTLFRKLDEPENFSVKELVVLARILKLKESEIVELIKKERKL